MMSQNSPKSRCSPGNSEIVAAGISHEIRLDAQHPAPEWKAAEPVTFCADWQGKDEDPERQTTVRLLWTPATLYMRFECRYRELFVFDDSDPNGRRDHLWDRDVAEAFLQPDPTRPRFYKEFEVSPNGLWIDLDISPGPLQDLKSGMQRSVWLDEHSRTWSADIAIPIKVFNIRFDPAAVWRANFYRVEGKKEPRFYSAWQPTNTPEPNFHVPGAFGRMRFLQAKRR
jgi:alpha-galactosidase